MLIVFEGIDGSGKNTQIRKLLSFLRQQGIRFKLHKYPTKNAKEVFAHLEGKKELTVEMLTQIFAEDILCEQDRLRDEMLGGFVVVCDRYLHSTVAYQGVKIGYAKVKRMVAKQGALVPDIVLLLDIEAREGARRKAGHKKPDRFEKDVKFLAAVRRNYLREAKENFLAYRFVVLDGSKKPGDVFSEMLMAVEPLLTKKMR